MQQEAALEKGKKTKKMGHFYWNSGLCIELRDLSGKFWLIGEELEDRFSKREVGMC